MRKPYISLFLPGKVATTLQGVIASPSLPVILTLNEMKGKNLIPLRINSAWQSLNTAPLRFFGRSSSSE